MRVQDGYQAIFSRARCRGDFSPKLPSSVNSVFLVVVFVVVVLVVDGVVGARTRKKRTLSPREQKSFDANSVLCFSLRACVSGTNEYCRYQLVGRISRDGSICIPGSASVRLIINNPSICSRARGVQAVLFGCFRASEERINPIP